MRLLSKFSILLCGLLAAMILPVAIYTKWDADITEYNKDIKQSMVTAAYDAIQTANVVNGKAFSTVSQRTEALNTFYSSLAAGSFAENVGQLDAYIPFVMLVDTDGLYVCYDKNYHNWGEDTEEYFVTPITNYAENYQTGGESYITTFTLGDMLSVYYEGKKIAEGTYASVKKKLQAEYPNSLNILIFLQSEDAFKNERTAVITNSVARLVQKYLNEGIDGYKSSGFNRHNTQYIFSIPTTENDDWQRALAGPTVMAFYHGEQLDFDTQYLAQIAFSGGELAPNEKYYVVYNPSSGLEYHVWGCPELISAGDNFTVYYSMEECARAGAHPHRGCIH